MPRREAPPPAMRLPARPPATFPAEAAVVGALPTQAVAVGTIERSIEFLLLERMIRVNGRELEASLEGFNSRPFYSLGDEGRRSGKAWWSD
jgi:hypothetical protein